MFIIDWHDLLLLDKSDDTVLLIIEHIIVEDITY